MSLEKSIVRHEAADENNASSALQIPSSVITLERTLSADDWVAIMRIMTERLNDFEVH